LTEPQWIEAAQREAAVKWAALREQAASSRAERKPQLEERRAEMKADYQGRTAKPREARGLRKEAWKLTRAAVIPDARDDVNVRRPLGRRR
jgi:hypothetical protein